jgi:DNA polymerase-3 subunit delta'
MAFTPTVALDYLRHAHEQNRFGHAYLISGPAGSGKMRLVNEIARLLNGANENGSSGMQIAEPESKSRRIVVDQIRGLEQALHMQSANGRRKIAVIADADRMVPQAANAFLKTLEEPPKDSLLLLTTTLPEALPDTILSRCISIPLAAPDSCTPDPEEVELIRVLDSVGAPNSSGVQDAYRLAQRFHALLAAMRSAIQEENAAALKAEETRYKQTTDGAWLDEREDYFKALTESQYVQRRARLIEVLYTWWNDVLRAKNAIERTDVPEARSRTTKIAARLSTADILRRIRRVEELRDHLGRNIQEALAVEVAFLTIFAF